MFSPSPYRRDAVQARVEDRVLIVTPVSGGTTLRLGPAEDGGMHPLRPVDQADMEQMLDTFTAGCRKVLRPAERDWPTRRRLLRRR